MLPHARHYFLGRATLDQRYQPARYTSIEYFIFQDIYLIAAQDAAVMIVFHRRFAMRDARAR